MKNKRYPNISMVIGVVLSLIYTSFIVSIFPVNHNIVSTFLSVGFLLVYWYAMYTAKKKFMTESFTVSEARFVNIGGLFLFCFSTFFTCLVKVF